MIEVNPDNSPVVSKKANNLFWAIAITLLALAIIANHYFSAILLPLRLAGWLILACGEIFLILKTKEGRKLWNFAKDAKIELRKVVWPTRQETVHTTIIIAALVIVMSLLMWGIDSIFMWAIGWIAGQR